MRAYEQDYAGWVEDTALAIEEGRFGEIDRCSLADEVRDLGKSERDRIESALRVLLMHLLKTRYQPERQSRSWEATIRVQRKHLAKFLRQSPSLRPEMAELLADSYDNARIDAANETGLDIDTFPENCAWSVEQAIGDTDGNADPVAKH